MYYFDIKSSEKYRNTCVKLTFLRVKGNYGSYERGISDRDWTVIKQV